MEGKYVIFGILMMVFGGFSALIYMIIDIIVSWSFTSSTSGVDWVCCCSFSGFFMLIGLILFIVGLVKDKSR
ncbi:MAG: hypothetical protein JXA22_06985 [Candidatus Thermoplasmatota archaeon]|nr:hypothetical protein [Candidatus Thermoplasmatota archaeon]